MSTTNTPRPRSRRPRSRPAEDQGPVRDAVDPIEAWSLLLAFASTRHGAFARIHAHQCFVSNKMLRLAVTQRRVQFLGRNAFRVAGSAPSWQQRLVIACDALSHSALASRRSAAALEGFAGFERRIVEVTTDQHRSMRRPGVIVHRTSLWVPDDRATVDGVPCTDPIRTFIDLGAILTPSRHEEVLDAAERDGFFTREALEDRLERIRVQGRNGVGYTARLLEVRAPQGRNPTNAFERKFLRLVERAGLPLPECQVPVRRPDGSIAWIDFLWIDVLFGVETDGHIAHATRAERRRDARRDRAVLERDIETVRYTWDEVMTEPDDVVRSLRRHLDRRARDLAAGRLVVPEDLATALRERRV